MAKFLIFIGASLLIILVLFLVSNRHKKAGLKTMEGFKKGPYLYKNLMALGTVFLTLIFSILFISDIILLIYELKLGPPLYILAGFILLLIFMSAYVVKSRVFNQDS
ncbi:MAG: hypothetical protein K9H14_02955 [Actinomycetia bacterium]|nr:hypothetical protein [Actinomycetes bacterium]